MKKSFLLFMFCAFYVCVSAQHLVTDSKVWNVDVYSPYEGSYDYSQAYILKGDTTLHGEPAKKLYFQKTEDCEPEYMMAMSEEAGKVWFAMEGKDEWSLAYDFGLNVGDETEVESIEGYGKYKVTVIAEKTQEIKGVMRKCMVVKTESMERESEPYQTLWVEGIGCISGIQKNGGNEVPTGMTRYQFSKCIENEEVIIDMDDITALENYLANKDWTHTPTIHAEETPIDCNDEFDLTGKRITDPRKGEIYIKDGKKFLK